MARPKDDFWKLLAVKHPGTQHRLLNLGAVFVGNILVQGSELTGIHGWLLLIEAARGDGRRNLVIVPKSGENSRLVDSDRHAGLVGIDSLLRRGKGQRTGTKEPNCNQE